MVPTKSRFDGPTSPFCHQSLAAQVLVGGRRYRRAQASDALARAKDSTRETTLDLGEMLPNLGLEHRRALQLSGGGDP